MQLLSTIYLILAFQAAQKDALLGAVMWSVMFAATYFNQAKHERVESQKDDGNL